MNKSRICAITVLLHFSLLTPVAYGEHVEGEEINVAMIACLVNAEAPNRMDVVASSVNLTQHHIPSISRGHSCAQNLHQLMTAGFEIKNASLENLVFVFLLTRKDVATHGH
jgi:hypothetical protein